MSEIVSDKKVDKKTDKKADKVKEVLKDIEEPKVEKGSLSDLFGYVEDEEDNKLDGDEVAEVELTEEEQLIENLIVRGAMRIGERRFGITCTGNPIGDTHWLADSSTCGDLVMCLPSSVLIAGRTKEAGGVGVDMYVFLDAVIEGAGSLCGIPGIVEASTLPAWAVSRLMGTFPALMGVYHEAIDLGLLTTEAAIIKAASGMKITNVRKMKKSRYGKPFEESEETLEKEIMPDPALSKFVLSSRMAARYKDDGDVKQAVQVNINGVEADL